MTNFDELWSVKPYGLTVVTGPHGVGKTIFALTTGAAPKRTFVLDGEQSARAYHEQLGFGKYIDLINDAPGYTAVGVYTLAKRVLEQARPGQYDVIVLDNVSPIEDGILEAVETTPVKFGLSPKQVQTGLKWGAVKRAYKALLLTAMAKAKMVIATVHLGSVWAGGKPVPGLQKPKGKDTLTELAVLRLWLRFSNNPAPNGLVLKSRLTFFDNGKVVPALPRKLVPATWERVRWYLSHPEWRQQPEPGLTAEELHLIRGTMSREQMELYKAVIMAAAMEERTQASDASAKEPTTNKPTKQTRPAEQPKQANKAQLIGRLMQAGLSVPNILNKTGKSDLNNVTVADLQKLLQNGG